MLLLLFLLGLVMPFTFADIPEQLGALALCAQVCVTSGLLNCGCGPTDFECSCNCPMFIPFSRKCLSVSCSLYRVDPSLNTLNTICSPFTKSATTIAEPQTSTTSSSSTFASNPTITLSTSSSLITPVKPPPNTLFTTTSESGGTVTTSTDSNGGVWTTTLGPIKTQTPGGGGYRMPYGTASSWGNVTGTTCVLPSNQTCLPIQVDGGSGVSIKWGWSTWLVLAIFIAVI